MRSLLRSLLTLTLCSLGVSAFAAPATEITRWGNQHGHGFTEVERNAAGEITLKQTFKRLTDSEGRTRRRTDMQVMPGFAQRSWQTRDYGVEFTAKSERTNGGGRTWERTITLKNGLQRFVTSKDVPGAPPLYIIPNGVGIHWALKELTKIATAQRRPIATRVNGTFGTVNPSK